MLRGVWKNLKTVCRVRVILLKKGEGLKSQGLPTLKFFVISVLNEMKRRFYRRNLETIMY